MATPGASKRVALAQCPSVEQLDVERLEVPGAHDAKLHLARLADWSAGVAEHGRRSRSSWPRAGDRRRRPRPGRSAARRWRSGSAAPLVSPRSASPGVPAGSAMAATSTSSTANPGSCRFTVRQRLPEQRAGNRQRDGHRHLRDDQRAIDEPARPGGDASRHPRRPDQPRDGPAGKHHHGDQREPDGKRRDAEIHRRRGEKWERRRQESAAAWRARRVRSTGRRTSLPTPARALRAPAGGPVCRRPRRAPIGSRARRGATRTPDAYNAARFAHAISSTASVAAASTSSGVRASATSCSRSGTRCARCGSGADGSDVRFSRSVAARAPTPGARRATTPNTCAPAALIELHR